MEMIHTLQMLAIKNITVIYIESFACIDHLSLSGKILYYLVDRFCVQWKSLQHKYAKAEYVGRIRDGQVYESLSGKEAIPETANKSVLITVGSTSFDELIEAADSVPFVECLKVLFRLQLHVLHCSVICNLKYGCGYILSSLSL